MRGGNNQSATYKRFVHGILNPRTLGYITEVGSEGFLLLGAWTAPVEGNGEEQAKKMPDGDFSNKKP